MSIVVMTPVLYVQANSSKGSDRKSSCTHAPPSYANSDDKTRVPRSHPTDLFNLIIISSAIQQALSHRL